MKTEKHYKYGVTMGNFNVFYEEYGKSPIQMWFARFMKKGKK